MIRCLMCLTVSNKEQGHDCSIIKKDDNITHFVLKVQ
jgi:hypothetical protein